MNKIFNNKSILITGGTGSFGLAAIKYCLKQKFKKIIIFSRDELKQFDIQNKFSDTRLRFFLGDVRDLSRLEYAFRDVDFVIHAAALKQVPAAEYNPIEAIKTNVIGAENVIKAAIKNKVKKIMALSTDKAVNPINLYGATKLCSDKLFIAANNYVGGINNSFSVTRYGNVIGSRGSVVEVFNNIVKNKSKFFPITNLQMTRFWMHLDYGVKFVFENFSRMKGGEIFVPKIPSIKISDLAKSIDNKIPQKEIGLRPGEKLHEVLISRDSSHHTIEFKDYYIIKPEFNFEKSKNFEVNEKNQKGKLLKKNFEYNSLNNTKYLTINDLKKKSNL